MEANELYYDSVIDGSDEAPDQLDRAKYARHIASLLGRVADGDDSSVFALIGPWGSGKSSVLQMTIESLKSGDEREKWLVGYFNPWNYPSLDSMVAGFFAELRDVLPKIDKWSNKRNRIGDFGRSVSSLGKVASLFGVDASSMITGVADIVTGDSSPKATRRKAQKSLASLGQPVLMVIDDVDRLTPSELLMVFKLVRQLGRLQNVYYLLCYDEKTVIEALKKTDLVGGSGARAQDYLEKVVQIRLDLPVLRDHQVDMLTNAAIEAVLSDCNVSLTQPQIERIAKAYQMHMKSMLSTPRRIRRLFAQLNAAYLVMDKEVDFVDFMIMTFIRVIEPSAYFMLYRHRHLLTVGGFTVNGFLERRKSDQERRDAWISRLKESDVLEENLEGMLGLLAVLFLPIDESLNKSVSNRGGVEDVWRRLGVGHADYFDRYFTFGVPDEDMPNSAVAEALRQIDTGDDGEALSQLTERIRVDTERTIRKIIMAMEAQTIDRRKLLYFLAESFGALSEPVSIFDGGAQHSLLALASRMGNELGSALDGELLNRISSLSEGIAFLAILGDTLPESHSARSAISALIRSALESAPSLDDIPDEIFNLIWPWGRIDLNGLRDWIRARIDSGDWPLVDVVTRFATVSRAVGNGPPRKVIATISLADLDAILGLSFVLSGLVDEIENATTHIDVFTAEPTIENRRDYALGVLKSTRDRMGVAAEPE